MTSRRDLLRGRWFQPEERAIPKAAPQLVPLSAFRPVPGKTPPLCPAEQGYEKETPPPWKKS